MKTLNRTINQRKLHQEQKPQYRGQQHIPRNYAHQQAKPVSSNYGGIFAPVFSSDISSGKIKIRDNQTFVQTHRFSAIPFMMNKIAMFGKLAFNQSFKRYYSTDQKQEQHKKQQESQQEHSQNQQQSQYKKDQGKAKNNGKENSEKQSFLLSDEKFFAAAEKLFFVILGAIGTLFYFYLQVFEERKKLYMQDINKWMEKTESYRKTTEKLFADAESLITNPLLRLYSKLDMEKIKKYTDNTLVINAQLLEIEHMRSLLALHKKTLEATCVEKYIVNKPLFHYLDFLDTQLKLQWYQLTIANYLTEVISLREKKNFMHALQVSDDAMKIIKDYGIFITQIPFIKDGVEHNIAFTKLLNQLRVNLHNHQAKIYRAQAGRNLKKLDIQLLEKSRNSYEEALKLQKDNATIISSLGFLLIDWAETETDSIKKKKLLNEAYDKQMQALNFEMQSSDIHHGLGYVMYHQQKLTHDLGESVDNKIIKQILAEFDQVNPSARLDRDRALVYELQGDIKKALTSLDEGYEKHPQDCLVLFDRGRLKIQLKDYVGAKQDLETGQSLYGYDANLVDLFEEQLEKLELSKSSPSFKR